MKPTLLLLLFLAMLTSSCVETTTTTPDGTVTQRKEADRAVLSFAGDVVRAYRPRTIQPTK